MDKIKRVSQIFRILMQMTFIVIPVVLAVFWINAPHPIPWLDSLGIQMNLIPVWLKTTAALSNSTKLIGFLVSLLPIGIVLFILYYMIRLFRFYEKSEIFTLNTVNCFRKIGIALVVGELIIEPIYDALISLTMSWSNPPGHRLIFITFSGTNLSLAVVGMIILLISWVMSEGVKLQEEQQLTV